MTEHTFEELFVMVVPTFVDLQGFTVGRKFAVKEMTVLRKGTILSHYIFASTISWDLASSLIANHHGLQWKDGIVPYSMAKRLITITVTGKEEGGDDDNETFVYVKEFKKKM